MPRERNDPQRDAAWLLDMLTAARAVQSFVAKRTFEDYKKDLMLRSAVERQVEIIGEAVRGLSQPFKVAHSEILGRRSRPHATASLTSTAKSTTPSSGGWRRSTCLR